MSYFVAKSLHIIGFVSWFAGLLYIVRLYIYDVEANERDPASRQVLHEQLRIMQRRLWYGITWPAMLATVLFGMWMVTERVMGNIPLGGWLHVKFLLLAFLIAYHLQCGRIRKQLLAGKFQWSSQRLRMWNELATLLLVAIVFDAVFKSTRNMLWGVVGLVIFGVVLMVAIRVYRRVRMRVQAAPDVG